MDNNRLLHTLYHCKIFYQIYLPYKKQWFLSRCSDFTNLLRLKKQSFVIKEGLPDGQFTEIFHAAHD